MTHTHTHTDGGGISDREKTENTPLRTFPIKHTHTHTLCIWPETNFLTAGLVYNILKRET